MSRRLDTPKVNIDIDDLPFGMVDDSSVDTRKLPKGAAEEIENIIIQGRDLVKRLGSEKANSTDLGAKPHSLYYFKEEI